MSGLARACNDPPPLGMLRLAAKLGYREEAHFRQARMVQGVYYGLGFGILRAEWQA